MDVAFRATPRILINTQEHEPSARLWSKQNQIMVLITYSSSP